MFVTTDGTVLIHYYQSRAKLYPDFLSLPLMSCFGLGIPSGIIFSHSGFLGSPGLTVSQIFLVLV